MNPAFIPYGPFLPSAESAAKHGERCFYGPPCRHGHRPVRVSYSGKCDQCTRECWERVRRRRGQAPFVSNQARAAAKIVGDSMFNGKDCKHGHGVLRWTHNNSCVKCTEIASKHHAKRTGYAFTRAWTMLNPEAIARAKKRYRQSDKGISAVHRDHASRRARLRSAPGTHTASDVARILIAQRRKCACCAARLLKTGWHLDHIIALSVGGSNDKYNLQVLCATCNLKKWKKLPHVFAQQMGRLL